MDEITQKNCVLIGTCIIVICLHFAYKFRSNKKLTNILLGIGFFTTLTMTKLLNDWEKENKVDYNLLFFLYVLLDVIFFCFLVYRFCSERNLLRGGGETQETSGTEYIVNEFKKQDFFVRLLENPVALKFLNNFKDNVAERLIQKFDIIRI